MAKNKFYAWKKFPGHYHDWMLELFNSREDEDSLPFLMRRPDIEPHSIFLNLNHPQYDHHHSEMGLYRGTMESRHVPRPISSAVFRHGRFREGTDFKGNSLETLKEFRGSLNEYFRENDFRPYFGEHIQEFLRNSNLDEKIIAAYSELFDE